MKRMKKIGLFFLLCTLLLLLFAVVASAEERGECGDGLTYTYADGTLSITGSGAMKNYDNNTNKAPWSHLRGEITRVEIGEGVTSVGEYAFAFCSALREVDFPETLERIGSDAFVNCSALLEISLPDAVRTLGISAFQGCTSLERVTSLGSISELKGSVFSGCTALSTVYFPRTLVSISATAFYRVSLSGLTVYYPDSPARFAQIEIIADGAATGAPIDPASYKKVYYSVRVSVQYVMVGSRAEAPTPPAVVLGFADGIDRYEIPVPEVEGHTHNVAGGVLTGSFTEHIEHEILLTVTYTPNKYSMTLYFVDHNGVALMKDGTELRYSKDVEYGELFEFDAKAFLEESGFSLYAPDKDFEGLLITKNETKMIACIPQRFTLTVKYLDTLDRTVAPSHTEQIYYTDAFSIPSPTPAFYTLDGPGEIAGVMGAEDAEYIVRYTPDSFTLTVVFEDEDGKTMLDEYGNGLPPIVRTCLYKTEYTVNAPGVPHYTPSLAAVTGVMDGFTDDEAASHSRTVRVTYTLNSYKLFVHLQDQSGRTIAEDLCYLVRYGEEFSFTPPTIEGYTAKTTEITGVMEQDGDMHRIAYYAPIAPTEEPLPTPPTRVWLVVTLVLLAVMASAGAAFYAIKRLK